VAVPRISKDELKQRLEAAGPSTPLIVDVRLKYPFEHSTLMLPGAIRMAPNALDPSRLPLGRDIVLYYYDPEELVSTNVARELQQAGFRVSVLSGGIAEWVAAKYPTDSKPAPQPAAISGSLKG
jgi:rhodanese-related sulfurtransferase